MAKSGQNRQFLVVYAKSYTRQHEKSTPLPEVTNISSVAFAPLCKYEESFGGLCFTSTICESWWSATTSIEEFVT